ncbi:MAG: hypothetical protein OEW08_15260, partial [Gammaproteobacteria bacterium]|nr:hypothetical protein [Gammaproteobacteria bacterium]
FTITLEGEANTAYVNSKLIGDYTYSDTENDAEGATQLQWLRNGQPIDGATSKRYTVVAADSGQTLQFQVIPVAVKGDAPSTAEASAGVKVENSPPIAKEVYLSSSGTASIPTSAGVQTVLTARYLFEDPDGDGVAQQGASFRWMRSKDATNTEFAAIPGQTSNTYTVKIDDLGLTLYAEITPHAATGVPDGVPQTTSRVEIKNSAPQVTSLAIVASAIPAVVGTVLTADYKIVDVDGDVTSAKFEWKKDAAPISATLSTYTVSAADIGHTFTVTVTPQAATGIAAGESKTSVGLTIGNAAPVASNVLLRADTTTLAVGTTLTASYDYFDKENDRESGSVTRWLRSGNVIMDNLVSSHTGLTYVLENADIGQTIQFEITPHAATGTLVGKAVLSNQMATNNQAPSASDIKFNPAVAKVGIPLTVSFTYSDNENDAPGAHRYEWKNASNTVIATGDNYTVQKSDAHQALTVTVTPYSTMGTTKGAAVTSAPITVENSPPGLDATGVKIVGLINNLAYKDVELNADYTFVDPDGDGEGATTYQWLRNGSPMGGEINKRYTVTIDDVGKTLSVQVRPKDILGAEGATVTSATVTPVNLPPEASNVAVTGTGQIGQTLRVDHTRSDLEKDPPPDAPNPAQNIRWLRGITPIASAANNITYTLTLADAGYDITAEVTPLAKTGASPGKPVSSNKITVPRLS